MSARLARSNDTRAITRTTDGVHHIDLVSLRNDLEITWVWQSPVIGCLLLSDIIYDMHYDH